MVTSLIMQRSKECYRILVRMLSMVCAYKLSLLATTFFHCQLDGLKWIHAIVNAKISDAWLFVDRFERGGLELEHEVRKGPGLGATDSETNQETEGLTFASGNWPVLDTLEAYQFIDALQCIK